MLKNFSHLKVLVVWSGILLFTSCSSQPVFNMSYTINEEEVIYGVRYSKLISKKDMEEIASVVRVKIKNSEYLYSAYVWDGKFVVQMIDNLEFIEKNNSVGLSGKAYSLNNEKGEWIVEEYGDWIQ